MTLIIIGSSATTFWTLGWGIDHGHMYLGMASLIWAFYAAIFPGFVKDPISIGLNCCLWIAGRLISLMELILTFISNLASVPVFWFFGRKTLDPRLAEVTAETLLAQSRHGIDDGFVLMLVRDIVDIYEVEDTLNLDWTKAAELFFLRDLTSVNPDHLLRRFDYVKKRLRPFGLSPRSRFVLKGLSSDQFLFWRWNVVTGRLEFRFRFILSSLNFLIWVNSIRTAQEKLLR